MTEPARHLHAVHPETGEIFEVAKCPNCASLQDQLAGAEKEIKAWRTRYAALKRDREAEAEASKWWGIAIALFLDWRIATGHLKSRWTAERFWLCHPFLEQDGYFICRLGVWGIAAHPNTKRVTKSYVETYDDWELVFRSRGTFERYVRRGAAIFGRDIPVPPSVEVPEWLNLPDYARMTP